MSEEMDELLMASKVPIGCEGSEATLEGLKQFQRGLQSVDG